MSNTTSRSTKALSVDHNRPQGCSGGCGLALFGTIFLIAGLIVGYFLIFQPLYGVLSARSWDETPCTIRSSELEINRGGENDSYVIAITYDYEYDGQPYVGDRYHFAIDNTNTNRQWKRRIVNEHPVGHQTVCYVNPEDPQESVIERGFTREMWWGLFPLPFIAVGLGVILFGVFKKKEPAGEDAARTPPAQLGSPSVTPAISGSRGPVTLQPEASPVFLFAVVLLFCLIWNGITGLFVVQVVNSFLGGDPEWFLAVFMTPFVLIGLVLLVAAGYLFLSIFNPRPELTLSRAPAPLGGLLEVSWRFRGSVRRIRNFKLSLKGEESATYRRGTDTHTDTETFFEHVFYEADHPVHIATGTAEFEVPTDSMHSFEADNNKVVWSLEVIGDIPLWPDIGLSFPIQVTPHEPIADPDA